MLSADIELIMLSKSPLAGATDAPYGKLRVDPDRFLPFHCCGLVASPAVGFDFSGASFLVAVVALGKALLCGGLAEVACVDVVTSVSLLPPRSRLLARWP